MRSAISMIPRFTPCNSSPPAGAIRSTKTSDISATIVSDWPTPTVSISTTSKPAASQSATASRVRRATPPRCVWLGEGRMKARGGRGQPLHPRLVAEDRAARAGRGRVDRQHRHAQPRPVSIVPKASMKVDLPTPGVPESPIRSACRPVVASRSSRRHGLVPDDRRARFRPA
jgi:hypothetical protein